MGEEIYQTLREKARQYVQCGSEGLKLESDYATFRYIHHHLSREYDRHLYKLVYENFKREFMLGEEEE